MKKLVLALIVGALSMAAHSQPTGYAGLSASTLDYEEPGVDLGLSTGVGVFAGVKLNDHVSIEAEYNNGGDAATYVFAQPVSVEVDYLLNFSAKLTLPTSNKYITPYARIGFTHGELVASSGFYSLRDNGTSFAYGLGLQSDINDKVFLQLGYQSYYDKDNIDLDGFRGSVGFKF